MVFQTALILFAGLCLVGLGFLVLYRYGFLDAAVTGGSTQSSLRDISGEYRERSLGIDVGRADGLEPAHLAEWEEEEANNFDNDRNTLHDKLKYAQLQGLPTYAVSLAQVAISLVAFALARTYLREPLQILSLFLGPIIVNGLLHRRIRKRVARFDADFPQFLLAVVGLLKTGLNPVQALQAATDNLEEDSLVRQEVELMLERFRVGVPEDRSIGSFGEDIAQPEIELFVQALILSRRVGGNLSDTLDRLSKQVRKRHAFKMSAESAVAQQRGSIWVIVFIMVAVELFMLRGAPEMVVGAWTDPRLMAWSQGAVVLIWCGVAWMNKITDIKI